MLHSYDYLQARMTDLHRDAEDHRRIAATPRRPRSKWAPHLRRRRQESGLGGCTS